MTLRGDLYSAIREAILLLDYQPGQVLSLRTLAGLYGVSATPIREVLIRLEAEGLVNIEPRNSARVTEVSLHDLAHVTEVRLVLADQVGRLAAQRITDEEISSLETVLSKIEGETNRRTLVALDSEFHRLVDEATKNPHLARVSGLLRNQVVRLWYLFGNDDSYWPTMRAGRRELLSALKRKAESECQENLRGHVAQFVEQLRETVMGSVE